MPGRPSGKAVRDLLAHPPEAKMSFSAMTRFLFLPKATAPAATLLLRVMAGSVFLYSLTRIAAVTRSSLLRRSGVKPSTAEPSGPVFPPVGVTPPLPEK